MVVVVACSLLRGCKMMETKRAAVWVLYTTARLSDDATRLQRAVPYLLTVIIDHGTSAGAAALRVMATQLAVPLLMSVRRFTRSDT